MKNTSTTSKPSKKPKQGLVQIAIWRDSPEFAKSQDVFTNYSHELFYDFSKPLHLLDSPGWHPTIQTKSDEGFYILSTNEKII